MVLRVKISVFRWCVVKKSVPVLENLCRENTSMDINYPWLPSDDGLKIIWIMPASWRLADCSKEGEWKIQLRFWEGGGGLVFGLMSALMENWERTENSSCNLTISSNHANVAIMKITFSLSLFPMRCSHRFPALLPMFWWTKTEVFFKHPSCNKESKLPADCTIMCLL